MYCDDLNGCGEVVRVGQNDDGTAKETRCGSINGNFVVFCKACSDKKMKAFLEQHTAKQGKQ